MKILFIYPRYPDTFWSFRHALKFISKKASFPPLGLLTVAAMVPEEWEQRLLDLNVSLLDDDDLRWADYVFISAMSVQEASVRSIINRCKKLGTKIVAGGPLFTARRDEFHDVDHLVLNEAEITFPLFLSDLHNGNLRHVYTTTEWADITTTPVPRLALIDFRNYASMNIQYSRGCPYDCEFCDITVLYGRRPRTKTKEQVIADLDNLYTAGWRGNVFFVDDNFIGNKAKVKDEILPAIIRWDQQRDFPFIFSTEASINLADDETLMTLMVQAGFDAVFIGIESPNEDSLIECGKVTNKNRDMIACVKKIQQFGLQVQGGFIVGFDNDPETIFEKLSAFIQESGIATAMVGLLNAPKGTKLYKRLKDEGRLLQSFTGDNTDFSMNFIPKMNYEVLLDGYKSILRYIYSPKHYYARVKEMLRYYKAPRLNKFEFRIDRLMALNKSILLLGVIGKERLQYWKLFFWTLFRKPRLFPLAISMSIYGFHFRKVFEQQIISLNVDG
jgi:radical SAM superfamily enzyme YgiQ (UPF0313 family)